MRLAHQLTIGFAALCSVAAGVGGAFELARERRHLLAELDHELRLVGTSVVVSIGDALHDGDPDQVQQHLGSIDHADPRVDVAVIRADGAVLAASPGLAAPAPLLALAETTVARGGAQAGEDDSVAPARYLVALPFPEGSARPERVVVVARPLDEVEAHLRAARTTLFIGSVLLLVATNALLFVLVRRRVARPLEALAAAMQRVMAGDFSVAPPATTTATGAADEVAALARAFAAMVAELAAARHRLAEEVAARTRLEQGLQHVDKLATLGELSAGLAHEIGSPLQVMEGRARSLLGTRADDPAEVRRNATILTAQIERICRIVERLLRLARRTPPCFARVDLEAPVRAVLDLFAESARRQGIRVELAVAAAVPPVRVDVDRLQQIVVNLVKNALEATPAGGCVTVALAPTAAGGAGLDVVDTGCGMDDATRTRIFEPFFTTRGARGGTGLGLAVVRALVLEHGGTVAASSVPGVGTRLRVELPAAAAEAAVEPTQGAAA